MRNHKPNRRRRKLQSESNQVWWFSADNKIGLIHLLMAREGVLQIKLPKKIRDRDEAPSNDDTPPQEVLEMLELVLRALEQAHVRPLNPEVLPLVFSGTAFQECVWRAIAQLKPGESITYGALAKKVGSPGAARAVGSACGANPFPLIIPCHRVVAAHGLGGFSGDLAIKSALLALEESP